MKAKVSLEIPLGKNPGMSHGSSEANKPALNDPVVHLNSKKFSTVALPGPCIYCGQPVDEDGFTWVKNKPFDLAEWVRSRKWGDYHLSVIKENGFSQTGNVKIIAPYCSEHKKAVTLYKWVRLGTILIGLLAGIIITVIAWPNLVTHSWLDIVAAVMMPGMGVFLGFILSSFLIRIAMLFMGAKKDYPTLNEGHWGLVVGGVRTDGGELGVGPIRYYLQLDFINSESAKRVYDAYPGTIITKGERLIISTDI